MLVSVVAVTAFLLQCATAQYYRIGNRDEILDSARTLAFDAMTFYNGNQSGEVPGILPGPPVHRGGYWWWESGAMMGIFVDYWYLTGDDSYNEVVAQGMVYQSEGYFIPRNFTNQIGNDDQGIWAMAAMLAAETQFPGPPGGEPQWLDLARGAFTSLSTRWDGDTCAGGLRWQLISFNNGYDYKNTLSTAVLFNLGARLAKFTGNETYAQWASDAFDWLWDVGYIDNGSWDVYDGSFVQSDCQEIHKAQFSLASAVLIHGMAFMYNYTGGDDIWRDRLEKLTDSTLAIFFPDNIAFEVACEAQRTCTVDMLIFKGLSHQWLAAATQAAPFLSEQILPVLRNSAEAAVQQCTGGSSGRECGFYWSRGRFVDPGEDDPAGEEDGVSGVGETLNVLAAVSRLLVNEASSPVTEEDGAPISNPDGSNEGTEENAAPGIGKHTVALIASMILAISL